MAKIKKKSVAASKIKHRRDMENVSNGFPFLIGVAREVTLFKKVTFGQRLKAGAGAAVLRHRTLQASTILLAICGTRM